MKRKSTDQEVTAPLFPPLGDGEFAGSHSLTATREPKVPAKVQMGGGSQMTGA